MENHSLITSSHIHTYDVQWWWGYFYPLNPLQMMGTFELCWWPVTARTNSQFIAFYLHKISWSSLCFQVLLEFQFEIIFLNWQKNRFLMHHLNCSAMSMRSIVKRNKKKRKEKKKKKTELSWIEFLMLPSFSHDVTSSPPPSNPFFSTAVFIRIFLRRRRRRRRRFFLFFHPFSPID